jgi:hypothetical protein
MDWYQKIKSALQPTSRWQGKITGGASFGLASNAIHYLDLFSWLMQDTPVSVDTTALEQQWYPSKRKNCWEIKGKLKINFQSGSELALQIADEHDRDVILQISTEKENWKIAESTGIAESGKGQQIAGQIEYQSGMTAALVSGILASGTCRLPSLDESLLQHKLLLTAFHQHWQQYMPVKELLPIT